jgi:putative flippase GtrA
MIPSVAKIVQQLHLEEEWDSVRVPKEVFFLPEKGTELHLLDVLRHTGLNILSFWNRKHFRSIPASSEAFIGSLITGRMYGHNIRRALCELSRTNVKVVECATHPGVNESQEVGAWSGDLVWHSHENRYKELGFILGPEYQKVMKEFGCEKGAECYSLVLQKTRFILAGLSATVTNLLVLYVSTEYVKMWYMASAVLAYIAATSISFYLQKYWTFHQGSRPYSKKEMALFFGNSSLAIVFSVYGLWLLVEHVGIWYMAAQIILIACIALWNFIFFKTYLFKSKSV